VPIADVASTDVAERFTIVRCAGCHVLRTWPVPADLSPYYATDLASTMTKPHSRVFAALRAVQLSRELARITRAGDPGPLVDVGCGSGDFFRVAAARGHPVIAADAIEHPPPGLNDHPHVRFVHFDFDTYELRGLGHVAPFTAILRHVLEHVRDPVACLTALRHQGARQLYVVAPNANSRERHLLGTNWYLWDPPRHLWHFDPTTVAHTCERAGFAPIATGTDTSPILLPSLYRALRLRRWPRPIYDLFGPTSLLTAVTAPLNLALPGNVLWLVARQ